MLHLAEALKSAQPNPAQTTTRVILGYSNHALLALAEENEVTVECSQVAFIEELQRRLTPANGKPLRLPGSKSSPNFVHVENNGEAGHPHETMEDLRAEPRSPFELRALEVALDVVRLLCPSRRNCLPCDRVGILPLI